MAKAAAHAPVCCQRRGSGTAAVVDAAAADDDDDDAQTIPRTTPPQTKKLNATQHHRPLTNETEGIDLNERPSNSGTKFLRLHTKRKDLPGYHEPFFFLGAELDRRILQLAGEFIAPLVSRLGGSVVLRGRKRTMNANASWLGTNLFLLLGDGALMSGVG